MNERKRNGMQYAITFTEGIITFISPCLLPMIPIYLTYFAGGGERTLSRSLKGSLGFVTGFTIVFVVLGALAGTAGSFLTGHQTAVNIICGLVIAAFGLNYAGLVRWSPFKGSGPMNPGNGGYIRSMIFGMVFSIGWTPCVGAFLGSALMMASQQGDILEGTVMLLLYSLGLGIPFILSALLIDQLKTAFDIIKRNYDIINRVSGILLVAVGILIATGLFGRLISSFS